jgi:catecholate siderophore receptor
VGVKWDIRPNLSVTAALFQLDRTNATTPDPADPRLTTVIGKTRTRGVELAITGRITRGWQVSGGYTYQDGHLQGNDDVRLAQVPRHQFALWNRYDFSPMFGAGIGVIHQSSQWAATRLVQVLPNPAPGLTTRLPSFTRVDAALFFKPTEKVELALNVENLFDKTYFSDAHNNNNISTGAPLNARLSLRLRY